MPTCDGNVCGVGLETVLSWEASQIHGSYRAGIEAFSFIIFILGVTLNTVVITVLISAWPNLDPFDGYIMNLAVGDLVSSFGLAFIFFVQFTTSLAPIGDSGCKFLNWLDVTCITITTVAIVAAVHELRQRVVYPTQPQTSRRTFLMVIFLSWFLASIPGVPYFSTAYMGPDNVCMLGHWSSESELIYSIMLFFLQIVVPIGALTILFLRIFLHFKAPREGDAALEDDATPGSEASLLRSISMRKTALMFGISLSFFIILTTVSLMELSLILDVNDLSKNTSKFARARIINELFLCLKCFTNPLFYFCYYDKFKLRCKQLCCKRNQDIYNSLNLRYNVYQQTVQEQPGNDSARNGGVNEYEIKDDEVFETERDDVAILDAAR